MPCSPWFAGEDDFDAPGLGPAPGAGADQPPGPEGRSSNGGAFADGLPASSTVARRKTLPTHSAKLVLAPDESALSRDHLAAELGALQSADEAASCAHRSLSAKNTLTTADADLVEAGFRDKARGFWRWAAR
jgi:hypothetical protein